jgi:DNA-binding MarR family transcriptional regulator
MAGRAATAEKGAPATGVSPLEPLLVNLLKLAAMISRPMQEGVALPNGLSLNELRILMCLYGEGSCAGHDITDLMAIPPMNVSRALATLAERGWIEPALDPANRRRRPMRLSEAGTRACEGMAGDIDAVARYLLGTLGQQEASAFNRTVDTVIERLERWPADHGKAG